MTAAEVLAKVIEAGGRIVSDAVPPKLLVPSSLKPLVVEHRDALRALLAGQGQDEERPPLASDRIGAYQRILGRLWDLAGQGADADAGDCAALLQEQARLCDDLGPEFAAAVSRQAAREWAHREHRCPTCGDPGVYHDPETGEECPLGLALRPRDGSGWLLRLHSLGERRPCPLTPCDRCGDGTFSIYGDTPLCRPCSDARGTA